VAAGDAHADRLLRAPGTDSLHCDAIAARGFLGRYRPRDREVEKREINLAQPGKLGRPRVFIRSKGNMHKPSPEKRALRPAVCCDELNDKGAIITGE
jgi:hypothetical protein